LLEYDLDVELQSWSRSPTYVFPKELAEAINRLWKDQAVPEFVENYGSQFYLMDSAA
jgi:hypothetical protein